MYIYLINRDDDDDDDASLTFKILYGMEGGDSNEITLIL